MEFCKVYKNWRYDTLEPKTEYCDMNWYKNCAGDVV
jgi:hypothetical protein